MLSQSANKQTRQVFHAQTQIYVVFWIIPLIWSLVINILNTQPSVFMTEMNLGKQCVIYEKIKKNVSQRTLFANQPEKEKRHAARP
jgi:putative exporter of polyketide antibiotics